jgi:hypothetical protein
MGGLSGLSGIALDCRVGFVKNGGVFSFFLWLLTFWVGLSSGGSLAVRFLFVSGVLLSFCRSVSGYFSAGWMGTDNRVWVGFSGRALPGYAATGGWGSWSSLFGWNGCRLYCGILLRL